MAWSDLIKEDFTEQYWVDLYAWFRNGGWEHVAAWLHARDLSSFNPKLAPPRTEAFLDMVEANLPTEDADFSKAIDLLSDDSIKPEALCVPMIRKAASPSFVNWLDERKNWRAIPHRLESCGYTPVRNPRFKYNRWQYRNHEGHRKEEAIYSLKILSPRKRESAADALIQDFRRKEPKWLIVLEKNKKM